MANAYYGAFAIFRTALSISHSFPARKPEKQSIASGVAYIGEPVELSLIVAAGLRGLGLDRRFSRLHLRAVGASPWATALAQRFDSLPSWNDGATKHAILSFIEDVTHPGSAAIAFLSQCRSRRNSVADRAVLRTRM